MGMGGNGNRGDAKKGNGKCSVGMGVGGNGNDTIGEGKNGNKNAIPAHLYYSVACQGNTKVAVVT